MEGRGLRVRAKRRLTTPFEYSGRATCPWSYEMPIKSVADLPQGFFLRIIDDDNDIQFYLADENGEMAMIGADIIGVLDVVRRDSQIWMAENLAAVHGWGPWIVDVAMEYAAENDAVIYPHHVGIVPEAKLMWDVYYNRRTDVQRIVMPDDWIVNLKVAHKEPELRCFYSKEPTILPELRALTKMWPPRGGTG